MSVSSELPELTYDRVSVGQRFQDAFLEVSPLLVRLYATAVQNSALAQEADAPPGTPLQDPSLLIIFGIARRVAARNGTLPPGGILARHDCAFYRPLRLGETVRTQTSIADKYEKRGRRYVQLRCEMFDQGGEPIGRIDNHIIWAR